MIFELSKIVAGVGENTGWVRETRTTRSQHLLELFAAHATGPAVTLFFRVAFCRLRNGNGLIPRFDSRKLGEVMQ